MPKLFRWLLIAAGGTRYLFAKVQILLGKKAQASTAPAIEMETASAFQTTAKAQITALPIKDMNISSRVGVSVRAALVAYRRAGLAYFRRLYFRVKAALDVAPGKTAPAFLEKVTLKPTAKVDTAPGTIVESKHTIGTAYEAHGTAVPATSVPGVAVGLNAQHTAQAGKAAVVEANINRAFQISHGAKMATWIAPEVVDGVLILRQAYSATMENDVLVVI